MHFALDLIRLRRSFTHTPTLLALMLLLAVAGCQQRTVSKLQGRWVGRPESAAARAAREAEKYADSPQSEEQFSKGSASDSDQSAIVTDWEKYDITVLMDFVSSDRLEMSLGEGQQSKSASWKIVVTSPIGCVIEVQTESEADGAQEPTVVRRRFELVLDEREDTCVGFLMTEVGADRQLGALYFERPE